MQVVNRHSLDETIGDSGFADLPFAV